MMTSHQIVCVGPSPGASLEPLAHHQNAPSLSLFCSYYFGRYSSESTQLRGGSRAAATPKMECFVIIVNGFQPLTIITKHSILDVASALDPLLQLVLHSWQLNFLVLVAGPLFILIGHMIILFFFLNVIKMCMSTVSFLVHLEFFVCLQNGFV